MATLKSNLVVSLTDRASGPARGIMGLMGRLRAAAPAGAGIAGQAAGFAALTRRLVAAGVGYLGVREGMRATVGGAMALETAMADVAKKTSLTEAGLAKMRQRIVDISNRTPLAATEIAALIAQAGQFGIANEDLERFALLGAKAAVAFDMGGEQTADSLSQLKNAFGLDMDQLTQLADAINFTADTAGASEGQVIDFLLRTAAAGKTFGISGQQLAAFGATLNEIGIDSAKAGTGMNAMMAKLAGLTKNKKAVQFLDKVGGKGYAAGLQKKFFDTPVEAMKEFFGVVGKLDAQSRSGFLIDFFGLEYQDDAAAIANNIETINRRLTELSDVSAYSGSVQKTFDIFAATTEQKLQRLRNNIANLFSGLGALALPGIVAFTDRLTETLGTLESRVTIFDTLKARVDGFLTGLGLDMSGGAAAAFETLWQGIFGSVEDLERDTDAMGAAFEKFRRMGASLRAFAEDAGVAVAGIGDLTGIDAETVKAVLGSVGGWGVTLAASAVGISLAAGALTKLGRAFLFLSGASALIGGAKGLARLLGVLGVGAAAGTAVPAAAGTAAAGGGLAALAGRLGSLKGLAVVAAGLTAAMYALKDWDGGVWHLPWGGEEPGAKKPADAAAPTIEPGVDPAWQPNDRRIDEERKADLDRLQRRLKYPPRSPIGRTDSILRQPGLTADDTIRARALEEWDRLKARKPMQGPPVPEPGFGETLKRFLFGRAVEPGFDFREHMRIRIRGDGDEQAPGGEGDDRLRDGAPVRIEGMAELQAFVASLAQRPTEPGTEAAATPREVSILGTPPVTIAGPVTTQPSGVQQVHVTNPPPAPVITVTVNATTNAPPAAIGQAVGDAVARRLRGVYSDGGQ